MILSFNDDEKDIYNGILEVISNSKCLEWYISVKTLTKPLRTECKS